jgi:hypothetical protein
LSDFTSDLASPTRTCVVGDPWRVAGNQAWSGN